jgi:hypothetical protein
MNHNYRFLFIPFLVKKDGSPDAPAMNTWMTGELKPGERVITMTSNPGVYVVLLLECDA